MHIYVVKLEYAYLAKFQRQGKWVYWFSDLDDKSLQLWQVDLQANNWPSLL